MKVVRVIGGLGNQMFQYAFYLSLLKKYPDTYLDISGFSNYKTHQFQLDRVFKLEKVQYFKPNIFQKFIFYIFSKKLILQDTLYHPNALSLSQKYVYLDGYWNTEKYFEEIKSLVRSEFEIKSEIDKKNRELLQLISETNSVSIHVRRGDYLSTELNKKIYGNICTIEYYKKAIHYIGSKVNNPKYFIYSNDINWCKKNLNLDGIYVDWNSDPKESFKDLHLMSTCKHNILANSTFSWWAGWLNQNSEKLVIVPSRFFNETIISNIETLIPTSWVRITV
jgi:hypothetical protein